MRISESTSYPHPILAPWSSDISGAEFSTEIKYLDNEKSNRLSIHCTVKLDQSDLLNLISDGSALFGCFIKCQETGFRRLLRIGFPTGGHDFAPGALLGRVQIRPMVWSVRPISGFRPAGTHPEFTSAFDLQPGQILALDEEQTIHVTRAPLPPIESIFEIGSSDELPESRFEIDTEADRIKVKMGMTTYKLVQELRQTTDDTRAVVMNSLYVPVLMEVLTRVAQGRPEAFEEYRWFTPFKFRCDLAGVDLSKLDAFNDAQRILSDPFMLLNKLAQIEEEQP